MLAPLEEQNLRTETLISCKCLINQKTKIYLLTSEHLPRILPHPQANEFTTWIMDGLFPLHSPCL